MKVISILLAVFFFSGLSAQDMKKFNAYHPEENAGMRIEETVQKAAAAKKNVLIQVGGNWCIWCARFIDFVKSDPELDSVMKAGYEVYHLNYSKENLNSDILARYQFPQRFGFPVFLVLDGQGNLLHTQDSGYLEEGKSYSKQKVMTFFTQWNVKALSPDNYKEQ